VVSLVAFHERGFSVPASRFIRGVLFAYRLQLQHLNTNNIQQMAAFEAMCKGFLGIGAHSHLFWYFFRFTYLREESRAATIGCANLRMKQGRGDDYIPAPLTSSNSGWHKGWFYLRNDPEHALPAYTGCSIAKSQRNKADGTPRLSRRGCSSPSGPCSGVFGTSRSPWRRWSGSITPEESCRSRGGRSGSTT
jgi:hypothetical protein